MAESWQIIPHKSIGPVHLGMTRKEVDLLSDQLGEIYAYHENKLPDGSVFYQESRDMGSPILIYTEDVVQEIMVDYHSKARVMFKGISIFEAPSSETLMALEQADGTALWGIGRLAFPNLSIQTSNFLISYDNSKKSPLYWENDPEQQPRTLTVAKPNAIDRNADYFEKISLLEAK